MVLKKKLLFLLVFVLGTYSHGFSLDNPEGNFVENDDEAQVFPRVVKIDTNKDGRADRFEYYEQGIIARIEADSDGNGDVDEWATIKDGKIVSVEKDSDADGKVDKWITY